EGPRERADEGRVGRHHGGGEVGGLRGRVGDEGPYGRLGDQLPAIDEDRGAGEPRRPHGELRAALAPAPHLRAVVDRDCHHCTRRRRKPEEYSTSMTMPMMTSRIAAAESNS